MSTKKGIDVRYLVKLIEPHREIWDNRSANYSNRKISFEAWKSVANKLNAKVSDCKTKWAGLRNSYVRLTKQDLTNPNKVRGKWYLEDQMSFLKSVVTYRIQRLQFLREKYLPTCQLSDDQKNVQDSTSECSSYSSDSSADSNEVHMECIDEDDLNKDNPTVLKKSKSDIATASKKQSDNISENIQILNKTKTDAANQTKAIPQSQNNNVNSLYNIIEKLSNQNSNETTLNLLDNLLEQLNKNQILNKSSDALFFLSIEKDFKNLPSTKQRKLKSILLNSMNQLLNEPEN